ncbi:MAG: hypothetical protein AB4290_30885, partial [Spirulina sp.]
MTEPTTLQQVTIAVPGSQTIALLLAGLLMAFSFQFIVANLEIIGGLIALGIRFAMKMEEADTTALSDTTPMEESPPPTASRRRKSQRRGRSARASQIAPGGLLAKATPSSNSSNTISLIAGLGIAGTIIAAIAPATFLAVKLSRVDRPILGAISGLVLWSAYFLILTWLSSRTLGSILQTVFGAALEGVGQLFGAIARLFRRKPTVTEDKVKQEIQTALADFNLDSRIQTYLKGLPPVQFDLKPIQEMMLPMLALPALQSIAGQQLLDAVDRNSLGRLLHQNTQFSEREIAQILDRLEPLWTMVRSQAPKQNPAAELVKLLEQMPIAETAKIQPIEATDVARAPDSSSIEAETESPKMAENERDAEKSTTPTEDNLSKLLGIAEGADISAMLLAMLDLVDADAVLNELLGQVDLSEWDVARLWGQFQQLRQRLTGKAVEPLSVLPEDVENYLLSAAPWELNPTVLEEDIPNLFYDPEADPTEMLRQLNLLNLDALTRILNQRGDLEPDTVQSLAAQLEALRLEAIARGNEALVAEQLDRLGLAFKADIEALPPEAIAPEPLAELLESLLEATAPDAILTLKAQLDPSTLTLWLQENTQLSPDVLPAVATALETCIETRAAQIEARRAEIQKAIEEGQTKLSAYLTYTSLDKLTDAGIRQKLQTLVEEIAVDPSELYQALPRLDAEILRDILSRRRSLNTERREQIVARIQACWREQVPEVRETEQIAQSFTQRLGETLQELARSQNADRLSLEDLKPYLIPLIRDPNLTLNNLARELSEIDWSPLFSLLAEIRFDPSQIRELLEWLQAQIYDAARLPRRWLSRLQDREQQFEQHIQRYLQHRTKEGLQPEKMRRDLQKMLQVEVKRAKIADTVDRVIGAATPELPEFPDADAIATILSDRDDMTPTEIETISHSLQTTWQDAFEQFQSAQQEAQAALNELWESLAKSLSALQLSPIALERIEQELDALLAPLSGSLEQLSDSLTLWLPNSPLATLRSRIETWNQAAIAQLVQTRDDLSDTVNDYIQAQL